MKHTLKILIPILLILALLIGACYFFLIARRDLTESVFTCLLYTSPSPRD